MNRTYQIGCMGASSVLLRRSPAYVRACAEMRRVVAETVMQGPRRECGRGEVRSVAGRSIGVEQGAGAARDQRRRSVWRADQRCQDGAVDAVEPPGPLADQAACRGVDALDLAAKRREIEPGFEHLVLDHSRSMASACRIWRHFCTVFLCPNALARD